MTPENSGRPKPKTGQKVERRNNVTQHSNVFMKGPHTHTPYHGYASFFCQIKHAVEISTASYSTFPPFNPTYTEVLQFFMVVEMYNLYY